MADSLQDGSGCWITATTQRLIHGIVNLGTAENVSKRGKNMQSILRAHGYMFLVVLNA